MLCTCCCSIIIDFWSGGRHVELLVSFLPVGHFHQDKGRQNFLGIFFHFRFGFSISSSGQISGQNFVPNWDCVFGNFSLLEFVWNGWIAAIRPRIRIYLSDQFKIRNLWTTFHQRSAFRGNEQWTLLPWKAAGVEFLHHRLLSSSFVTEIACIRPFNH